MIIYCLIGLIALVLLLTWLQTRRYAKLIEDLTDKVMSRNYDDYIMGQAVKKEDKQKEVKKKGRNDTEEFLIEQSNLHGKKLEDLEKEWKDKIKDVTI